MANDTNGDRSTAQVSADADVPLHNVPSHTIVQKARSNRHRNLSVEGNVATADHSGQLDRTTDTRYFGLARILLTVIASPLIPRLEWKSWCSRLCVCEVFFE